MGLIERAEVPRSNGHGPPEGGGSDRPDDPAQGRPPVGAQLIPEGWARGTYVGVVALVLALIAIDVTEVFGWNVDNTTLALIAFFAVLPLLGRLSSLTVGTDGRVSLAFEQRIRDAEDQAKRSEVSAARATELAGMAMGDGGIAPPSEPDRPPAAFATRRRNLLGDRRRGLGGTLLEEADAPAGVAAAPAATAATHTVPFERIVWVDDHPEGNVPYREELERRWTVVTATSTDAGRGLIGADPARTLVITDAARSESNATNYQAGIELLAWLSAAHPEVPAFVFAGPETVRDHLVELRDAGALVVTADFTTLLGAMTLVDASRFEEAVEATVRAAGLELERLAPGRDAGADLIARRADGRKIAIAVKAWRRVPPPGLIAQTADRLAAEQGRRGAEEAMLVVPDCHLRAVRERLTEFTPVELRIVGFDELPRHLRG